MYPNLGGKLTGSIIGAAIAVHRELGPGLNEPIYETAFCTQLSAMGISYSYQRPLPLIYKGTKLDCGYRMDVVANQCLVVELKSVDSILPVHEAQLLTYLRISRIELGLLLNFDVAVLKDGIRRRALSSGWEIPSNAEHCPAAESFDRLSRVVLESALEVHRHLGPGLLRSSYESALCYELSRRQIPFERRTMLELQFRDRPVNAATEIDLLVDGQLPVVCLSLGVITSLEKARLLSRMRQGMWRTGLILDFNVQLLRDGICRLVY